MRTVTEAVDYLHTAIDLLTETDNLDKVCRDCCVDQILAAVNILLEQPLQGEGK